MKKIKAIIGMIGMYLLMMPTVLAVEVEKPLSYVKCGTTNGIPAPMPLMTSIAFTLLIIGTPLVFIAFGIVTLVKAVTAQKEDEIMKARNKLLRKLIAALLVFVVAGFSQFVIKRAADDSEKETITTCLSCFLYNSGCVEDPDALRPDVSPPPGYDPNAVPERDKSGSNTNANQPGRNSALSPSCNSTVPTARSDYIYGTGITRYPTTDCTTLANYMITITVPAWKMNSGNWVSSTVSIQVNKKLETEVRSIFQEIYDESDRAIKSGNASRATPIKSIGGWRCSDSCRNHPSGTAIDINPTENYYIKGTTTVGTHWSPGVDIYSMPADGIIVQTFKKYGWDWGGDWSSLKDYMHFSYLGG